MKNNYTEIELLRDIYIISENIYYLRYENIGSLFMKNIYNDLIRINIQYKFNMDIKEILTYFYLLNKNYEILKKLNEIEIKF